MSRLKKQPQLKIPSPAELELDKARDRMWQDANRKPERLFQLIREEAREVKKEFALNNRNGVTARSGQYFLVQTIKKGSRKEVQQHGWSQVSVTHNDHADVQA